MVEVVPVSNILNSLVTLSEYLGQLVARSAQYRDHTNKKSINPTQFEVMIALELFVIKYSTLAFKGKLFCSSIQQIEIFGNST